MWSLSKWLIRFLMGVGVHAAFPIVDEEWDETGVDGQSEDEVVRSGDVLKERDDEEEGREEVRKRCL